MLSQADQLISFCFILKVNQSLKNINLEASCTVAHCYKSCVEVCTLMMFNQLTMWWSTYKVECSEQLLKFLFLENVIHLLYCTFWEKICVSLCACVYAHACLWLCVAQSTWRVEDSGNIFIKEYNNNNVNIQNFTCRYCYMNMSQFSALHL